jgi:transcriptional regulator with XRE-family HTH domain
MKKLVLAALLCAFAAQAFAARRVSVAELERMLNQVRNHSDFSIAEMLAGLELTERCSAVRLAQWESSAPGRHTHDALAALADASILLDLPASELPPDAAPSLDEQRRIIKLTVDYVVQTFPRLPNFLADRQTVYYEDSVAQASFLIYGRNRMPTADSEPLHVISRSTVHVAYRDGKEVLDTSNGRHTPFISRRQLTTNGEFGPILGLLAFDAAKGSLAWSHWERGASGMEAHFSMTVPQNHSHFRVDLPCGSGDSAHFPAYYGEFAVDPAIGAVLRLLVSATLPFPCPAVSSTIATEFGQIELGGRTYICPLHSVSISTAPADASNGPRTQLNDVVFTHYRLFRAESRIVSVGDEPAQQPD